MRPLQGPVAGPGSHLRRKSEVCSAGKEFSSEPQGVRWRHEPEVRKGKYIPLCSEAEGVAPAGQAPPASRRLLFRGSRQGRGAPNRRSLAWGACSEGRSRDMSAPGVCCAWTPKALVWGCLDIPRHPSPLKLRLFNAGSPASPAFPDSLFESFPLIPLCSRPSFHLTGPTTASSGLMDLLGQLPELRKALY